MAKGSLFGMPLRTYFAGAWQIERQIEDRRAQGIGIFTGEGRFTGQRDGAMRYREKGTLSIDGQVFPAVRDYVWTFTQGGIDVAFADGRFFHRLEPSGGKATARHRCTPDDYRVVYSFDAPDRWCQTWCVVGPRKDYTLKSVFTRLHPVSLPVQSAQL